jgi:pyridoxine/pyridoxamine 5'-phosphate oxidase
MNEAEIVDFIRSYKWAVEATLSTTLSPQAAIIGIAATDQLELVFDTLASSRKAINLQTNPRMALVIGGWNEQDSRTVQYEGVADFPDGAELERIKQVYFATFADGPTRLSWPGITYVRVKPTWIRYSDFRCVPPVITESVFPMGR